MSKWTKKQKKKWKKLRKQLIKQQKYCSNKVFNFRENDNQSILSEEKEIPEMNDITLQDVVVSQIKNKSDIKLEVKANVILPLEIYNKMLTYTKLIDTEINGMGLVEQLNLTNFKITEIFLLKQNVTGGSCDIEQNSMVKLAERLIEEGKNPGMLRFWWHSHPKMGTFWSAVDENTGREFGGSEYFISIVINQEGKMKCKINLFKPMELVLDDVGIIIEYPINNENLIEECKMDIEENVITKIYKPKIGFHNNNIKQIEEKGKEENKTILTLTDIDENGPFDSQFVEGSVRFIWDKNIMKYRGYCMFANRELTDEEMIERTGLDYNNPYWLEEATRFNRALAKK